MDESYKALHIDVDRITGALESRLISIYPLWRHAHGEYYSFLVNS